MSADISRDLVVRARRGDREAFRLLLEQLARQTYNIAYRMSYNAADAEDLTQEIFLRLHRNLDKYDPALPFLPWFRTLATNLCLNHRKRVGAAKAASLDAMEGMDVAGPPDPAPSGDVSERLRRAVQDLPAEYRMVVTYLYFEGLGVSEIADAMSVPVGTVKTWLFRARDRLKEKLKPLIGAKL